ncbi:nicotinate-nucleotide adenylyltransferase [Simiduia litorea]|uniref:nicotinate-nucleotide adenylyltransferase n=1 Tax=Simiduia litorea TaxID=1435348 RepID=UPI0036F27F3B
MTSGLGIFGGTFDPIHTGHVGLALQVCRQLNVTQLRLMPTRLPPHRGNPTASGEQRAAMVQLAIAGCPNLSLDSRELARNRTSYTIDSLREIRLEEGEQTPLFFVLGMDSLNALDSWRDWQKLTDYAHLVVVARPGQAWPIPSSVVGEWLVGRVREAEAMPFGCCGQVIRLDADFPQSATAIRAALRAGATSHDWLAPSVSAYIQTHQLYPREP